MHKVECNALQRWEVDAPSPELAIPGDAIRCLGRILWGMQKFGLDSTWVCEIPCLIIVYLLSFTDTGVQRDAITYVSFHSTVIHFYSRIGSSDRTSLPTIAFESHTHLAHSVVRYLGVSSPAELAPFGLSSAGDLVDLISRVSRFITVTRTGIINPYFVVHDKHLHVNIPIFVANWCMYFAHHGATEPFM